MYARSSYSYNNMFITNLLSDIILILSIVLVFNPETLQERLSLCLVSSHYVIMFSVSCSMLENYFK